MFDFEKLTVYQKAKSYYSAVDSCMKGCKTNSDTRDQLDRAALSIVLNIAEGSGRFTNADKRRFLVMARSSIFETVAVLDILHDGVHLSEEDFGLLYEIAEEISRMLYAMIRKLEV